MNLKKYIWLAALPIAFTACQDEVLVENHNSEQGITTLFGIMDDGLSDSRAQIALGNNNTKTEKFMWNVGDKFTLFQTWQEGAESLLYSIHPFTISNDYTYDKYGSKGAFSTDEPLVDGRNYVAFYPTESLVGEEANPNGYVSFGISDEIKDNTSDAWVKYFNENMFMQSIGTVAEGRRDLYFNHLCGIIRITYTNATKVDHELKGIYVNGSLGVHRQFNLSEPNDNTGDGNSLRHGVEFTDKAIVKAGESEDFYILFFPPTIYGTVTTIEPMTEIFVDYDVAGENNHLSSTPEQYQGKKFSYKGFEAGKCYWFKISGVGNERLQWTKDMNGGEGGDDEEPTIDRHIAEVDTFEELVEALSVNARSTDINFIDNVSLEHSLTIERPTNFYMAGHKITLASNYDSGEQESVFDVSTRLYIKHGTLEGKDGEKIHDYYFKLSGEEADLSMRGISLKTGSAISNAIFMDDDCLNMEIQRISETESVSCSIETSGNAIHLNASKTDPQLWSRINGTINGNVLVETEFNTLNTYMIFQTGNINGSLTCNVPSALDVSEYIVRSLENVTIGSGYEQSWNQAGRYVENPIIYVTNESDLKNAIESAQIAKEQTIIYLSNDITLTSPLTIVKPVELHLSENTLTLSNNFVWGTSDAAIIVASDATTGKSGSLKIYGRYNQVSTSSGVIQGSTAETGKYLIKNSVNDLWVENVTLNAQNKLNAICVENSRLIIDGDYPTDITTATGCYALNMMAKKQRTLVNLQCSVNIVGNVGFEGEYSGTDYSTLSKYLEGTCSIKGDLIKTGEYKDHLKINLGESVIEGSGWYPEVSTLQQIQELARSGHQKMFLTAPLTITDEDSKDGNPVNLCLYGATLLLSDSFDWSNGTAITLTGSLHKSIFGGTIKASTNEENKYLIKSFSEISLGSDLTLIAEGKLNAVYVENVHFDVNSSSIKAIDGYALDIMASAQSCASVGIHKGTTVTGKIRFENNNPAMPGGEVEPSSFRVFESQVKGDLTLDGSNKNGLEIVVTNGGSIIGNGWPEINVDGGGSGNNDIDPNAKAVGTLDELMNALTWDGPIYLTADIELTSPLVVEYPKPIFMNGHTVSLSPNFNFGDADAAITSKSGLVFLGEGLLVGLDTEETIEKAFLKSEESLQLEGVTINPYAFATAIYVQDGSCMVNPGSYIAEARRYAIDMDANHSCDVDIYKSTVYGDIRFALNAQTYGNGDNFCRFGVGPSSQVNGDLIIDGAYKDTATGYHLEVEKTAKTNGNGWNDTRIESVSAN